MEFVREKAGKYGESLGKAKLYVNDKVVAEGDMKTQTGKFTLSGFWESKISDFFKKTYWLSLQRINDFQKSKTVKVGISSADLADTMLAHDDGRVRVVK
jgi:hypothetical protein